MKRSVSHAGARLRLSVGPGPRKKLLFQENYPLYETFQNQNRSDVLGQESEGEVTQGEKSSFGFYCVIVRLDPSHFPLTIEELTPGPYL